MCVYDDELISFAHTHTFGQQQQQQTKTLKVFESSPSWIGRITPPPRPEPKQLAAKVCVWPLPRVVRLAYLFTLSSFLSPRTHTPPLLGAPTCLYFCFYKHDVKLKTRCLRRRLSKPWKRRRCLSILTRRSFCWPKFLLLLLHPVSRCYCLLLFVRRLLPCSTRSEFPRLFLKVSYSFLQHAMIY